MNDGIYSIVEDEDGEMDGRMDWTAEEDPPRRSRAG